MIGLLCEESHTHAKPISIQCASIGRDALEYDACWTNLPSRSHANRYLYRLSENGQQALEDVNLGCRIL